MSTNSFRELCRSKPRSFVDKTVFPLVDLLLDLGVGCLLSEFGLDDDLLFDIVVLIPSELEMLDAAECLLLLLLCGRRAGLSGARSPNPNDFENIKCFLLSDDFGIGVSFLWLKRSSCSFPPSLQPSNRSALSDFELITACCCVLCDLFTDGACCCCWGSSHSGRAILL